MKHQLQAMHRRAQRAEGQLKRVRWWLERLHRLSSDHLGRRFIAAALRAAGRNTGDAALLEWSLGRRADNGSVARTLLRSHLESAEKELATNPEDNWLRAKLLALQLFEADLRRHQYAPLATPSAELLFELVRDLEERQQASPSEETARTLAAFKAL